MRMVLSESRLVWIWEGGEGEGEEEGQGSLAVKAVVRPGGGCLRLSALVRGPCLRLSALVRGPGSVCAPRILR